MQPILEIQGIGKKFNIGQQKESYLSLRESLTGIFKKTKKEEEFWALKDVSFNVYPGESIGIIGRNGAGKSTLLKILSKITPPSKGNIISRGRIASLLEVGTGFHMELTGRENIYLNGSILGLKKAEINKQFDAIVDFSGVERFIDTQLKHYSSGMQLRLAFAVAAHLEPEILIIDEVLAVGDAEFQKKCMGKIGNVAKSGRTILFVSHNMSQIETLCSKAMVLKNGTTNGLVATDLAIADYMTSRENASNLSNQKWNQYVTLDRYMIQNKFVYTYDTIQISVAISFTIQPDIKGFSILIYNAIGIRVGIVDLRDHFKIEGKQLKASVSLLKLPLVAGLYAFGIYLDSNAGMFDFYDLISIEILEKEDADLLKYPSNVRGIIDIPFQTIEEL